MIDVLLVVTSEYFGDTLIILYKLFIIINNFNNFFFLVFGVFLVG